jgi:hypothetical protein
MGANAFDQAALIYLPKWKKGGASSGVAHSVKPITGVGDLICIRAGSLGTFTDSDGIVKVAAVNEPRLDFTGGLNCPVLLIEESAEMLAESSLISDGSPLQCDVIPVLDGPIEGSTAQLIQEQALTGTGYQQRFLNEPLNDGLNVISFYYRKHTDGNDRDVMINLSGGISGRVVINTSTNLWASPITQGDIQSTSDGVAIGGGWYRASVLIDATGQSSGNITLQPYNRAETAWNYDGDGVSGIQLDGLNITAGDQLTSFIPKFVSSGSSVTRPEDQISVSNLITKGIISADAGSLWLDLEYQAKSGNSGAWQLIGSTDDDLISCSEDDVQFKAAGVLESTSTGVADADDFNGSILISWNASTAEIHRKNQLVQAGITFTGGGSLQDLTLTGVVGQTKIRALGLWNFQLESTAAQAISNI